MLTTKSWAVAAVAAAGLAAPTLAHHSGAMFDRDVVVTLTGTLAEAQYVNPHSIVIIDVPDGQGGTEQWAVEFGGGGAMLVRVLPREVAPGTPITIDVYPLRDGRNGGSYIAHEVLTNDPAEEAAPEAAAPAEAAPEAAPAEPAPADAPASGN